MGPPVRQPQESLWQRVSHRIFGKPRDPHDPNLGHQLSLVAFLAWVGLGVDGLSSSAYGPEEAFRALGGHTYLAIFLAIATAITVCVISFAYSRLIEHFPHGGGGYVVATQLLGRPAGVVSGCALLVDYILTITVSIAGGGDALFSLLPLHLHHYKIPLEVTAIFFLIFINLRGVKESVKAVVPFFLLFILTHAVLILGGIGSHISEVPDLIRQTGTDLKQGFSQLGYWGLAVVFLKAYCMGGGTYTGIEAVSNGVGAMREPRVTTGKKTMLMLAISLSITAGGLLLCYMLFGVRPVPGQTLNASLAQSFSQNWVISGISVGYGFVLLTMFSESILLLVAAQTGFIDGPRVMANMAVDSWLPRRFASLSDRLTIKNGILMIGVAALLLLLFTRGKLGILVVMYSINVFLTFSVSQAAMIKFWIHSRKVQRYWKRNCAVHVVGFLMCFSILCVMIVEKFLEGAWMTLIITGVAVALCVAIRNHYARVGLRIKHLEFSDGKTPEMGKKFTGDLRPFDAEKPTAVILVGGYSRLGRRSLAAVMESFPHTFQNIVFLSVGVINSEFFKKNNVSEIKRRTEESLKSYVDIAEQSYGIPARFAYRVGADVVHEAPQLCIETSKLYPHCTFFAGEIVFDHDSLLNRILHNETAHAIQRQIRFAGLSLVILPILISSVEENEKS